MRYNISVIIPTLNEEANIGNLLHDLTSQTLHPYDVIVIDGHSEDATIDIVKSFKSVRCLKAKANPASQRHLGAMKAKGNLLVFLDADTRIKPNFLQNIHRIFSNNAIAFACPWYIPLSRRLSSLTLYTFFNVIFFGVQKLMPCGAGSCIIVKRTTYMQTGGFDPNFRFDDMHFLSKAKKYGKFATLWEKVYVSDRRIQKLGFIKSFILYLRLSWYFIRNDYQGANTVKYPFAFYKHSK